MPGILRLPAFSVCGIFFFTYAALLSLRFCPLILQEILHQAGQSYQVLVAKAASPASDLYERISVSHIRAARNNPVYLVIAVTEVNAVLAPAYEMVDQLELLTEQGMKGMGYSKTF
jgi:hypothetical protein